jgi:hypothetical protein
MQNNTYFQNVTNEPNTKQMGFGNVPNVRNPMTNMTISTHNLQNAPSVVNCETDSIFNKTCNEVSNRLIGEPDLLNSSNFNFSKINNPVETTNFIKIKEYEQSAGAQVANYQGSNDNVQSDSATNVIIEGGKKEYYSLFGYEFSSFWTLVLGLLILITVMYILYKIYKWFMSSDSQIVSIRKSKEIIELEKTPKDKLNNEISDSEDSDSNTSSNTSTSTHTHTTLSSNTRATSNKKLTESKPTIKKEENTQKKSKKENKKE